MKLDRPALPAFSPPSFALRSALAARRGVDRVQRAMALPIVRVLEQTISMAEVQATAAFAELGVADALADGSRTAAELAAAVGARPDALDRLLRFLATRGIVARNADRFGLTAASDLLRADHPDSVRDWVLFQASAWQWQAWAHLTDGLRTDATPFERAHGASYFDFLTSNADAGTQFDAAMRSTSHLQGQLVERALDLGGVERICDVGGGTGSVLARLVAASSADGVLFELSSTLARAEAVIAWTGVADRIELVAGDMFDQIPGGCDRYLLSAIIHDWSDDEAGAILRNLRAAMGSGAKAWIVELELPSHDGAALERAYDLLMLTLGGGRERTLAEFERLYAAAGLRLDDNRLLDNGWHVHELVAS